MIDLIILRLLCLIGHNVSFTRDAGILFNFLNVLCYFIHTIFIIIGKDRFFILKHIFDILIDDKFLKTL